MTKTVLPVSFYFGANNSGGYCSLFKNTYNPYSEGNHLILKGGPGTGKSTIMKRVAEKMEKRGYYVERGYCSADPQSLDIVLVPEINFSICDGTSPHTIDPTLPGVTEHIIDLSVAWDKKYLKSHFNEIAELTLANKQQHKKAAEYIKIASSVETQNLILCNNFIDKEKLDRYIKRLENRIITERTDYKEGKEHKRFLSAITPDGIDVRYDSVVALSEKIITIEDEYSIVSPYIIKKLSDYAVRMGYDVYKCYCPLFPEFKAEHLIIPTLKTAIFTQNGYHYSIDDESKVTHASRFCDKDGLSTIKEKLMFGKSAKKELINEAVKKMSIAKDLHDRLEEYYIKATDFDVINEISERIINKI